MKLQNKWKRVLFLLFILVLSQLNIMVVSGYLDVPGEIYSIQWVENGNKLITLDQYNGMLGWDFAFNHSNRQSMSLDVMYSEPFGSVNMADINSNGEVIIDFNNGSLMYSNSSHSFQQVKFGGLTNISRSKTQLQWCSTQRICYIENKKLMIHDLRTNNTQDYDMVTSFHQSEFSDYLIFSNGNNKIYVLAPNNTLTEYIPDIPNWMDVTHVAVDNKMSTIVISNDMRAVYIYDIATNVTNQILEVDVYEEITAIQWSPTFNEFAYSMTDGFIKIYSLLEQKYVNSFQQHDSETTDFSWSDYEFIAIVTPGDLYIWDLVTNTSENYIQTVLATHPDPWGVSAFPSLLSGFISFLMIMVISNYSKILKRKRKYD